MTGVSSAGSSASPPKLHQNPEETLHIRRLENGLERPCGRSDENLGHFSSLVGVVIARKLTYGNFVAIPAIAENKNTRRYWEDFWLTSQSRANPSQGRNLPAFTKMQGDFEKMQRGANCNRAKSAHFSITCIASPYSRSREIQSLL